MSKTVNVLRKLKEAIPGCTMISLQVGGAGDLEQTPEDESRLYIIASGRYLTISVTDDEWENTELRIVTELSAIAIPAFKNND